jgi:hypothetical protein
MVTFCNLFDRATIESTLAMKRLVYFLTMGNLTVMNGRINLQIWGYTKFEVKVFCRIFAIVNKPCEAR